MKNNIHSNKQHISSGGSIIYGFDQGLKLRLITNPKEHGEVPNSSWVHKVERGLLQHGRYYDQSKKRLEDPCMGKHTKSIDITLSKSNYVNTLWWWVCIVHHNIIQQAFHDLWALGIGGRCPQIAQDITPIILQLSILRSKVGLDSSTRRKRTSLWSCRGDARSP